MLQNNSGKHMQLEIGASRKGQTALGEIKRIMNKKKKRVQVYF